MEYYSAIKPRKSYHFLTTWMDLEGIMLSEISQRRKKILCDLSYMELKKNSSSHHGSAETHLTSIHEDACLTPGLTQWVKDPALP